MGLFRDGRRYDGTLIFANEGLTSSYYLKKIISESYKVKSDLI
jgi:hypothetical protein